MQEAALLPTLVEHLWDVNPVLHEDSPVGTFLKALFGYNGNPSLIEVVSYVGYFLAIYVGTRSGSQRQVASTASP
jgi:high-affinity iron transporter